MDINIGVTIRAGPGGGNQGLPDVPFVPDQNGTYISPKAWIFATNQKLNAKQTLRSDNR